MSKAVLELQKKASFDREVVKTCRCFSAEDTYNEAS